MKSEHWVESLTMWGNFLNDNPYFPKSPHFCIVRLFKANMSPDEMILEKRESFGIFLLSKHGRSFILGFTRHKLELTSMKCPGALV